MELLELDRDSFHNAISTSSLDVFLDQQLDQLIALSEPAHVCLCLIILRRTQRRRPDVDSNAKAAEVRLNAASLWLTQHVAEHPHPSRRLIMLVEEATKLSKAGWWLNENDDKDDDKDDDEDDKNNNEAAAAINVPTTIYRRPWLETHRTFQIDGLTIELTQRPVDRLDQTTPQAERTGMVVWNAAVVLAHAARNFLLKNNHRRHRLRVLELGAGLGLPGLVAAATAKEVGVLSCEVVLTDLPGVLPETMSNMNTVAKALGLNTNTNMTSNKNKKVLEGVASLELKAAPLRWGNQEELSQALGGDMEGIDLVLAADCVYFRESHTALVRTLGQVLQRGRRKRRKEEVVEEEEEVEEEVEVEEFLLNCTILLSYKSRNVRIEKEFFQLLRVNGMRALDLPIPLSLQSKEAAKKILGYDDELAFVGIKMMRVVMDLD